MFTHCPFSTFLPLAQARGTVRLPGSKSISNRVLLLAALAEGTTTVHDLLDSDDTRVMLDALRRARLRHRAARRRRVRIDGLGGQAAASPARRCFSATPAPPCGR